MIEREIGHSDQKYVEALLHNDHGLISEIYERFSGKVIAFVKGNHGDESDASDLIQEVLVIIYRQATEKKLVLTCPFEAYFLLLCKRKWWNHLKSDRREVTIDGELTSVDRQTEEEVDSTEAYELKSSLFGRKFQELSDKCRELLNLSLKLDSMKEVAEKLGVTYAYVRKKKSTCMGRLTELVRESDEYKTLNQ